MKAQSRVLKFFLKALSIPIVTFITGGLLATAIQILFERSIRTDIVLLLVFLSVFIFYTVITIEKVNKTAASSADKNYENIINTITSMQKDVLAQVQSLSLATRWVPNPTIARDEGYELSLKVVQSAQKSIYIISDYSPPDRPITYTDERREYLSVIAEVVRKHIENNSPFEYKRILQTNRADDVTNRILVKSHLAGDGQTFEHCIEVIKLIQENRSQVTAELFVSKPIPNSPSILIVDQKHVLFTIPSKKGVIESTNHDYADLATFGVLYFEDHTGKLATDFTRMFDSFANDSRPVASIAR